MFKNVLIAEDHESINISLRKTLDDLGIENPTCKGYCDHAFKIVKAMISREEPFDLLITDLSFEEDGNKQELSGGKELIRAVRKLQPNLKIIVFSFESSITVVDELFNELDIDGYVRKARYDAEDLKRAIDAVYNNKKYRSADIVKSAKRKVNTHDFTAFDLEIINHLCDGKTQKEIPDLLKQKNFKPSGLSSVEKRLNHMKTVLNFSNNGQLIAYCKDKKII